MRKTNRNLKRIKFIKKMIIFAIAQVFIILAICSSINTLPASMDDDTSQISGVPDKIKIRKNRTIRRWGEVSCITLYFDDLELDHVIISEELEEKDDEEIKNILMEKTLYITYFDKTKTILEMYNEDTVFTTSNDFYNSRVISKSFVVFGKVSLALICAFIEVVFSIFLWMNINTDWNDVKPNKKRKRSADIKSDKKKCSYI